MTRAWLICGLLSTGCAHQPTTGRSVAAPPAMAEAESLRVVPPDAPPKLFFKNVPAATLGALLKAQPAPSLPDEIKRRAAGDLTGTYVVGVDLDGHVSRIDVLQSIPGADSAIVATLQKWRFTPQSERVRFLQRFVFTAPAHP